MEAQKVTFKSQRKASFQQDLSGGYSALAHILTPPSSPFLLKTPSPGEADATATGQGGRGTR